jgi:transglutaminase-like putative cysteine protease
VIKERPPFAASYHIPYRGGDGELIPYIQPEAFLQSEDEEVISAAREIVRGATEPYKAAEMLMEWVFESIEKTPLVSIPDAKQILRHRKGDCNEHATLLTALLRAVGIPARMAVGLVYKDGKFYYHAWNEAYLDRWISMDATLNQIPADATHIKLIDGGIDRQIQIIGMIGNLSLTIVEYR